MILAGYFGIYRDSKAVTVWSAGLGSSKNPTVSPEACA